MRETELKAVVPDEAACLAHLLQAGATIVSRGRIEDRRYDYPDRRLTMRDVVLRLRVYRNSEGIKASLDWKGAASFEAGYKHREELSVSIADAVQMSGILNALGFVVTRAVDRTVQMLHLGEAVLRFERFPRMDTLLEVEGPGPAIEAAIRASGIPRNAFVTDRLYMFVQRYEARSGQRAAISDDESMGHYAFPLEDA
jgi:predicted adenylyl cyclase CyaB